MGSIAGLLIAVGHADAVEIAQPPAGRGYELVSHADAGSMYTTMPFFQTEGWEQDPVHPASPDGERLLFMTPGPVPGTPATRGNIPYVAARGAHWTQQYVGASGDAVDLSQLAGTSPDLFTTINLVQGTGVLGGRLDPARDADDDEDLYARGPAGTFTFGSPSTLPGARTTATMLNMASGGDTWTYYTTSLDGGGGETQSPVLVLTESGPEAVSVLDEGPVASPVLDPNAAAPLSPDGSRVVFRSRAFDGTGPMRIWVRLRDEGRTVLASAAEPGVGSADVDADLDVLSADGSAVLFTTAQALTLDDLDDQVDLYRFDIGTEDVELVSVAAPGAPSDGQATVCNSTYGAVGCAVSPGTYSTDGTTAYFVSPEALDVGAVTGAPNLYVRRGGVTRLAAVLADGDAGEFGAVGITWRAQRRPYRPVRVTDDGSRIAFESRAQLTGYDNAGVVETYVYDADLDRIWCASCAKGPSLSANEPAQFRTDWTDPEAPDPVLQGAGLVQGRNMANDGAVVYFQTAERLAAADVNGRTDVYEYDVAADRVTLISSGAGDVGSLYIDNSTDGEDVFFFSSDELVPASQDRNGTTWKVFDARRNGGFEEDVPPARCGEAACRGMLMPSPGFGGPVTDSTSGGGNVTQRRVRLRLRAPGRRALRRAARTGRLTLRVHSSSPRLVRVTATARFGKRLRRVAHGTLRVGRAGSARIRLRLSPRARRALARGPLSVSVRATAVGSRATTRRLLLRRAGSSTRRRTGTAPGQGASP